MARAQQAGAPLDLDDPLFQPVRVMDFAPLAKAKLDPVAWGYLETGSEDEVTLRRNREAFDDLVIRPRSLVRMQSVDLATQFLGRNLDFPIILCPAGGKNCFFPNGEAEVARAAAATKAVHIHNSGAEQVQASGKGPVWWQLTTGAQLSSSTNMRRWVRSLEDRGCSGICFSVDIMYVSHRDRNLRNKLDRAWCEAGIPPRDAQGNLPKPQNPERAGVYPARRTPTPDWDTVGELCSLTKLPVSIKGILRGDDAELAIQHGVRCIHVSNHGARQLDHTPATIEVLSEIAQAVKGRVPVVVDGGFRRGTDIFKAIALGATAVAIARPYLYGLAAFGQRGVERVIELLRTELALDMALAGTPNLAAIDRGMVKYRREFRQL